MLRDLELKYSSGGGPDKEAQDAEHESDEDSEDDLEDDEMEEVEPERQLLTERDWLRQQMGLYWSRGGQETVKDDSNIKEMVSKSTVAMNAWLPQVVDLSGAVKDCISTFLVYLHAGLGEPNLVKDQAWIHENFCIIEPKYKILFRYFRYCSQGSSECLTGVQMVA